MSRESPLAAAVATILIWGVIWFVISPDGFGHAVATFNQAVSGGCKP